MKISCNKVYQNYWYCTVKQNLMLYCKFCSWKYVSLPVVVSSWLILFRHAPNEMYNSQTLACAQKQRCGWLGPFKWEALKCENNSFYHIKSYNIIPPFTTDNCPLCPFFQPKDHKMIKPGAFQAEEKELVFDIDMTDYDEVRTCCKWAIFLTLDCQTW